MSKGKCLLTMLLSIGWTAEAFAGDIVTTEENFNIENEVTADFIRNVTYPDDDYSYTRITDYAERTTKYLKDLPQPVRLAVPQTTDGEKLLLETYCGDVLARSDTFAIGQQLLEVWNLIPQTAYTYRLYTLNTDETREEVASGAFATEGQVRMLRFEGMRNCRDIGGWQLPGGKHVRYDRVFRSAELAMTSQLITEAGIHELLDVQHVAVEIDFGGYSDSSPISDLVEFVHGNSYQVTFYSEGLRTKKLQFKNCFRRVVRSLRAGKKVLFHCSQGADRAGTFAFLLEGLLGVAESDLAKDYELTSFYCKYRYRIHSKNSYEIAYLDYKGMVDYIKANFEGSTLKEKIESMLLSFGVTQEDIDDFRRMMTEDDTLVSSGQKCATPDITMSNGRLHFDCATEGVTFHPTMEADIAGNDIAVPSRFLIKVRATKEGLTDSNEAKTYVTIPKGDVNGDGRVTITDAVSVLNIILGNTF